MFLVLIAVLLQSPAQITIPKAPSTVSPKATERRPEAVPQIGRIRSNTTPDLDPNAELTHAQMELDIGSEKEAIANLKTQVQTLQSLRADPDRKDIDGLKDTKTYITISSSVLFTVAVFLFGFRNVIWSDIIKPRLKKEILGVTQPNP
jgi:hypothetical protein